MLADYKCRECSHIFEYKKEYKKDFPDKLKCPKCGSINTYKMFKSSIIVPDVFKSPYN